jgi:hypothetical protein
MRSPRRPSRPNAPVLYWHAARGLLLASEDAEAEKFSYEKEMELVCAQPKVRLYIDTPYKMPLRSVFKVVPKPSGRPITDTLIDLKDIGCSTETRQVSFGVILSAAPDPSRLFCTRLPFAMALSALIAFILNLIVRAIGWVIGGFGSSG